VAKFNVSTQHSAIVVFKEIFESKLLSFLFKLNWSSGNWLD